MIEYMIISTIVTLFFLHRAGKVEKDYIKEVSHYGVDEDTAKIALAVIPLTYGLLWPIFVPLWLGTKIYSIFHKR